MRFSAIQAFAVAAPTILVATTAHSATVKEVLERYDQLGTFAWDCSQPPSKDNHYFVTRVIDDNHVQRDTMIGTTERLHVAIIDKAEPLGPNQLSLSGKRDQQMGEAIWYVEQNRQIALEASLDGKKVISGGKLVANGQQVRWSNKCDEPAR